MRAVRERTTDRQAPQSTISRVDATIVSTIHMEVAHPDATHMFMPISERSGRRRELLDPATGEIDTTRSRSCEITLGVAEIQLNQ